MTYTGAMREHSFSNRESTYSPAECVSALISMSDTITKKLYLHCFSKQTRPLH